jgi:hypothetical protein
MSEEIKDQALAALQGVIDRLVERVQQKFQAENYSTRVLRIDYVAQIALLEFCSDVEQPDAERCDAIGSSLRQEWPDMPDARVALFRLANKKSKLIIDIGTAAQSAKTANTVCDGVVAEPFIRAAERSHGKTSTFPMLKYDLTQKTVEREELTVEITPDALG